MDAPSIVLSHAELVQLTRYERAERQLEVLHLRGFHRAYIGRDKTVVLERAHYEAVCRGEVQLARPRVKPPVVKHLARA
jgi:hypothetical protein